MASNFISRLFRGANGAFTSVFWGNNTSSVPLYKMAHDVDTLVDTDNPLPTSDSNASTKLTLIANNQGVAQNSLDAISANAQSTNQKLDTALTNETAAQATRLTINTAIGSVDSKTTSLVNLANNTSLALGANSDLAWAGTGNAGVISLLKGLYTLLDLQQTGNSAEPIYTQSYGAAYTASGKTYSVVTLANNTITTAFSPLAGRPFYLTASGTGNTTLTVVWSRDGGSTFIPEIVGVDGSAPIIANKIAYANTPGVISLEVAEANVQVAVLPTTVNGTVTVKFSQ